MVHHKIVALERIHQPLPSSFDLSPPHTYNLTTYDRPDLSLLASRVRDATILIITTIRLGAEILSADVTPNLQLVAVILGYNGAYVVWDGNTTVMATGTDPVDLEACKKRGIRVTNCPGANIDAVSEHAISLYFAARRRTVMLDAATKKVPSDWKEKKTLTGLLRFKDGKAPLSCSDEVMGVVGYGSLGKRIAEIGRALGMRVIVAGRKNAPAPSASANGLLPPASNNDRLPFEEVLRRSTVLVLSLPRNPETMDLISTPEFAIMSPYAVVINIARGGIINEQALVDAAKTGQIAGAATDVFVKEPAEGPEESPLLSEEAKDLNITVSPHLAWFAQRTMTNLGQILKETIEAWVDGKDINVIV